MEELLHLFVNAEQIADDSARVCPGPELLVFGFCIRHGPRVPLDQRIRVGQVPVTYDDVRLDQTRRRPHPKHTPPIDDNALGLSRRRNLDPHFPYYVLNAVADRFEPTYWVVHAVGELGRRQQGEDPRRCLRREAYIERLKGEHLPQLPRFKESPQYKIQRPQQFQWVDFGSLRHQLDQRLGADFGEIPLDEVWHAEIQGPSCHLQKPTVLLARPLFARLKLLHHLLLVHQQIQRVHSVSITAVEKPIGCRLDLLQLDADNAE